MAVCRKFPGGTSISHYACKRPLLSLINLQRGPTENTSRGRFPLCDVTAYAEVCLRSRCLEAGCITPLFHCCVWVSRSVYRVVAWKCVDKSQYVGLMHRSYLRTCRKYFGQFKGRETSCSLQLFLPVFQYAMCQQITKRKTSRFLAFPQNIHIQALKFHSGKRKLENWNLKL
jgi:hypothetical protein